MSTDLDSLVTTKELAPIWAVSVVFDIDTVLLSEDPEK